MSTGTVKWFNEEKGFGFIIGEEGGRDIFVHRSAVTTPGQVLQEGQSVEFEEAEGPKGPKAVNVRVT